MQRTLIALCLCLFVAASPAAAQQGGLFLDGSVFAGIELHGGVETSEPGTTSDTLSATVAGGGFGVGASLAPRVGIHLEVAIPGGSNATVSRTTTLSELAPELATTITTREDYASWNTAVLVSYRAGTRGRLNLELLGGVAIMRERSDAVSEVSTPGIPPFIPPQVTQDELKAISYRTGVALGADVEVPLRPNLSVVPQVRFVGFNGRIGLRPGVAIRWRP